MVRASPRTDLTGSALIRLLARLLDAKVPEPGNAFADRLSQWLGWADAISLSAALLAGAPATRAAGNAAQRAGSGPSPESGAERDAAALRSRLARAIADEGASTARPALPGAGGPAPDAESDFPTLRRRYLARQQAMEAGIGPLRARLRELLATRSPAMARLAAVDAVMEQVLGAREQHLLSGVPAMLEGHFARLRASEPAAPEGAPPRRAEWPRRFQQDVRSLLLAELEIRMQPVEGLLEALRASPVTPT